MSKWIIFVHDKALGRALTESELLDRGWKWRGNILSVPPQETAKAARKGAGKSNNK
jgi:hypothetical protein